MGSTPSAYMQTNKPVNQTRKEETGSSTPSVHMQTNEHVDRTRKEETGSSTTSAHMQTNEHVNLTRKEETGSSTPSALMNTPVDPRLKKETDSIQPPVQSDKCSSDSSLQPESKEANSQEPLPPLESGEIDVGNYRITLYPSINTGAFGMVCGGIHKETREKIAAKGIKISNQGRIYHEMQSMAIAEADNMKKVSHLNIVKLLDYCEHKETVWLFMEFCHLGDLEKYLEDNPSLPFEKKINIMYEITLAMFKLHNHSPQIIHRDIKPQNVLMTDVDGQHVAKLSDFGFAKLYDHSLSQSGSAFYTSFRGTSRYMAPEFFLKEEGELSYSTSVDIFSLGLVNVVIMDYGPQNMSTIPVSVQKRKASKKAIFGREMAEAYKDKRPLPSIVEPSQNDNDIKIKLKDLISKMTSFESKNRPRINQVQSILESIKGQSADTSLQGLLRKDLNQSKQVQLSAWPWMLKRMGDELWSCQRDGIAVYSGELELLRTVRHGDWPWVYSVALLPDLIVAVAGLSQLYLVTPSGERLRAVADVEYNDVVVHGGELYAAAQESPVIDVYDCHTLTKQRSIPTPCRDTKHSLNFYWHYICVNDTTLKLSCGDLKKLYILDTHGEVISSHGPDISITEPASTAAASAHSTRTSRLRCPHICQEDAEGAVLVADEDNDRLLVLSAAGQWRQVALRQPLKWPRGAVYWRGRLYVSTWDDKKLTMFE